MTAIVYAYHYGRVWITSVVTNKCGYYWVNVAEYCSKEYETAVITRMLSRPNSIRQGREIQDQGGQS
eukprot:COSAG05_NODE_1094_length_5906_cov_299.271569_8_plen_67_part_00